MPFNNCLSASIELETEFSGSDASKGRLLILKVKDALADENYLDAKGKISPIGKSGSVSKKFTAK